MTETRSEQQQQPLVGTEGRRPPLPSLTGMRGVASVIVFLCHIMILAGDLPYDIDILHIFEDAELRENYRYAVGFIGYTCVSFFFVTSGFILTWAQRAKDTRARFWRRRLFKIFPLHLVTYAIGLVVLTGSMSSAADIPAVFLVQNWTPDLRVIFSANGPSWSISAELFFYAMFPLLLAWIMKIRENRLLLWLIGTGVVLLAVTVFSHLTLSAAHQVWFSYVFPPVRILEFIAGIILARLIISGRWIRLGMGPAALILLASCVVARALPEVYAFAAATFVPVVLIVGAAIRDDVEGIRSPLRSRFLVWLGDLSFAFYLVHLSVLVGARKLVGTEQSWGVAGAALFIVITYAVTLFCAWVLHNYVENPAMRRWSSPKRPVGEKTAAPRAVRGTE
ncbi:acyltransferase [Streptomyces inusitatus]|uniref:Acyltransferase n=1 Tax=Streptomyces inusitatus TaxID=68221 RepID=A0A918UUA8_9ACTN|nr:acyltransferase [Streptomyces inusitatus]GGZ35921.1 acyltransferase [Streptomyces inusitatus]